MITMENKIEMAPSSRRSFNGAGVRRITGFKVVTLQRIGTWNVRTLYESGKLDNVTREMTRLGIQVLGINETRWKESGTCQSNGYRMYYSGGSEHARGVAVIVTEEINKSVLNFVPISDRCMILQLKSTPVNVNIIQVYAPTADKSDDEVEDFYAILNNALKYTKKRDVNLLMGDFNAKVGKGRVENIVGEFGLGERNERGDRLIEFSQENELVITNTWYTLPPRRLYTWKSPQDNAQQVIRNQIDFIIVNKRFRNVIKSVKTYPGADVNSDHNLLVAKLRIILKADKKTKSQNRMNINGLKDMQVYEQVKTTLNNRITQCEIGSQDVNKNWEEIKSAFITTGEEMLKREKRPTKQIWMTDEILNLMDQRRTCKINKNPQEYKNIQKEIRSKIKIAKERWIAEECAEIELLQQKHDTFHLHKKLKEVAGVVKKRCPTCMRDPQNGLLMTNEEKILAWSKYISVLFEDDNRPSLNIDTAAISEGPIILESEVKYAIQQSKNGKTPGPDNIPGELLKLLDDHCLSKITKFFNQIYLSGIIPEAWLKSTFITIPKKSNPNSCNDFRLISLMSHVLKILLKVIQNRIYRKCESTIADAQFGFRSGLGTRDALFCMQILLQKCRDLRQDVYVCFIDFEKAFDRVQHGILIDTLRSSGLDEKDIRLIENLYWKQRATVKVEDEESEEVEIRRGVRQGCILSPLLFNIYSEQIFQKALDEREEGIKVNGHVINNIRYADDTVLIAKDIVELQTLLNLVNSECGERGLTINIKKTKLMVISRQNVNHIDLRLHGESIDRVNKFMYLGCWINDCLDPDAEIKTRIEVARTGFMKFKSVLCDKNLEISTRMRFIKCYVWSQLLYGVETWTLKVSTMNKLEAFEMWILRRMLRIPWTKKISNVKVLEMVGEDRQLLRVVKQRKTRYLGHIFRGEKYSFLRLIIEGKVAGKRGIGRRKMTWFQNIRQWTGLSFEKLVHLDREEFKIVVANL